MITHGEGHRNTPLEKLAADGGHLHTHGDGHDEGHTHTHGDGHEHAHTHADGHTHTHDDGHGHTHIHAGGHGHLHSDGTGHSHGAGHIDKAKLVSLLGYMSEHNFEHANELRNLIGAASELGDENVADMIEQSANDIENAAQNIAVALDLIKGV